MRGPDSVREQQLGAVPRYLDNTSDEGEGSGPIVSQTSVSPEGDGERLRVPKVLDAQLIAALHTAIVDSAIDAIIAMDHLGQVIEFNPAAAAIFGYSREDAVGRHLADLIIPAEMRDAHSKGLKHFLATGEGPVLGQRVEIEALRSDGSSFPVELSIVAVEQQNAPPVFTAHLRDVSSRLEAEAQLRDLLEQAESASRAKDAFLANMSHEIRTPLSAMLGYADLITSRLPAEAGVFDWLEVIRSNGKYLDRILVDLLDIGRIESGDLEIVAEGCSLSEIISAEITTWTHRASDQGLTLRVEITGEVPAYFQSDPARLRQILSNLLGNALKYTREGQVVLEAKAERCDGERAEIHFSVSDSGCGIPADRLTDALRAFTRVHEAESSVEGFGLGLSIVQRVVALMKGKLEIESEVGVGTCVKVLVPVEGAKSWGDLSSSWTQISTAQPSPREGGLSSHVLVVDDSEDLSHLFQLWLVGWGCEVKVASGGNAALDLVEREEFDLILMDWRMAELDGLSATRELRDRGFKNPIIGLTAHASGKARDEFLAAGCDAVLTKPVDSSTLFGAVASFVEEDVERAPSKVEDRIAALRERFRVSLVEQVVHMRVLHGEQRYHELAAMAHQVKGSAGSFGFMEVARSVEELEAALSEGAERAVEGALEQLVREIDCAGATAGPESRS